MIPRNNHDSPSVAIDYSIHQSGQEVKSVVVLRSKFRVGVWRPEGDPADKVASNNDRVRIGIRGSSCRQRSMSACSVDSSSSFPIGSRGDLWRSEMCRIEYDIPHRAYGKAPRSLPLAGATLSAGVGVPRVMES